MPNSSVDNHSADTGRAKAGDVTETGNVTAEQSEISQADGLQIGLWATILSCLFAAAPATYPGYWQSGEGFVPVFNAAKINAVASVATIPDFWRGMGSATFLLTQPLVSLGLQSTTAVRITFMLAIVLGALAIYAWLLPKLGERAAGLAASIYALFPPFLSTIYERGSLSDALIMGLFPVALMGASSYKQSRTISGLGVLLISILWMWRVQAGMAAFATVLILLYVGIVEQDWRGALGAIVSGALGLATWLLFGHISAPPAVPFAENFVPFYQLLLNRLLPTNSEVMQQFAYQPNSIQLGFAVLGLSILALWYWRFGLSGKANGDSAVSLPSSINRSLWFGLLISVVLVVLSLGLSNPLWQATGADRFLTYPFQILLLSAPFLALLAGSLLVVNRSFAHMPYWLVLIAMTLLNGAPYLMPTYTQLAPDGQPFAVLGDNYHTVVLEAKLFEDFSEKTEEQHAMDVTLNLLAGFPLNDPPEAILEVTWQTLRTPELDYNVFFQALVPEGDTLSVFTQIDVQPLDGERPATSWQVGEILTDHYRLDLSDLPERAEGETANLQYYFGYYDWQEGGTRQPILATDSQEIDDKLIFYGK